MIRSKSVVSAAVLALLLCGVGAAQQSPPNPVAKAQQAAEQAKKGAVAAPQAAQKVAAEKAAAAKGAAAAKKPVEPAATRQPAEAKAADKDESQPVATVVDHTADDEALAAAIEAFEKAYNDRDAQAIAAMFTPEAQIVDADGLTFQGREDIEQVFTALFEDQPEAIITTEVTDLKYIGTALAIETGRTTLIPSPGDPAVNDEYTVVHVKTRDGKWLMALARDTPAQMLDHTENLLPLSFLVGDWVDESPEAVVETRYEWSDGDKFIVGKFSVKMLGEEAFSGTQRIGWDPMAKKIRSWVFDSNGGFQEGMWTRVGDEWLVKYQGVSGEGEPTAGTSVMSLISDERWTWQSRDRIVGDELLEDTPEVQVVRKGPLPEVDEVAVIEEVEQ